MNVQSLINHALPFIDDVTGSYGVERLPLVSKIISDLMRLEIGITASYIRVNMSTYTADYTVEDYVPVRLSVLSEEQIMNVQMDGYPDMKMYTETNNNLFYILVPETYSGIIVVKYMAAVKDFTALSDIVPISDSACISVASIGLAALLALSEANKKVNYLEEKYQEAIQSWKKRNINKPRKIRGYYNLECENG